MNKRTASLIAQLSVLSSMVGSSFLNYNHNHDHEYRDKIKTKCKGVSAEEMGTAHNKKKPRKFRKRR